MSTVIKIENLSKYYRLGLIGGGTLHEDLSRWAAKMRGKPDPLMKLGEQDHGNRKGGQIWALRDVNLEVKEGEILGIIGRNGAGKSTLLKILSKITAPTEGRVKIKGRVGSLLEVGTGFHPELTGRENIYLNGTILGMSREEITRKLEEIIEFAEMSKFIDTPVKRYSSGMTVRLAFAVAAHLEPEILIVDEVLAVGDAAFQKKCIGKMGEVASHGRTVLFVSHNMGMIRSLCSRAVLLKDGSINCSGEVVEIINKYSGSMLEQARTKLNKFPVVSKKYNLYLNSVETNLVRENNHYNLYIELSLLSNEQDMNVGVGMSIKTSQGMLISNLGPVVTGKVINLNRNIEQFIKISVTDLEEKITGGDYLVSLWVEYIGKEMLLYFDNISSFHMDALDCFGTGILLENRIHGITPILSFSIDCRNNVNDI